jgi:hypothetical protein
MKAVRAAKQLRAQVYRRAFPFTILFDSRRIRSFVTQYSTFPPPPPADPGWVGNQIVYAVVCNTTVQRTISV